MADVTLTLRRNKQTGKQELTIHMESDSDALAHEHERDHRALVEGLIGSPLEDGATITVTRLAPKQAAPGTAVPATPVQQRGTVKQGS